MSIRFFFDDGAPPADRQSAENRESSPIIDSTRGNRDISRDVITIASRAIRSVTQQPARRLPHSETIDLLRRARRQTDGEPGVRTIDLPPAHERVAEDRFEELDVSLDPVSETYWCRMRPSGRPAYTPALLRGLSAMQTSLVRLHADYPTPPFRYFVVSSNHPGVFNLGGDLALFAELIGERDRDALHAYATACIDVVHANYVDYDLPIVTIGLVQGDALGGGFEAALSCDIVVAEKGVRFGFPEVLFNLFPGMGAFSILSRKIGGASAEAMVSSGRIYLAEELHAMGLVHVLAEPGQGEAAVSEFISRNRRRHNATASMQAASRRAHPLPYAELADIVDLWVDAALSLDRADLRKMARLVSAQDRRSEPAVALRAAGT